MRPACLLALLPAALWAGDALEDLDRDCAGLAAVAERATVLVRAEGAEEGLKGSSGVVIQASGFVLSDGDASRLRKRGNSHGDKAQVRFPDGRVLPARLLKRDEGTDSSLWKVEPSGAELKAVRPGSSAPVLQGSLTLLCGNAFGTGEEGHPAFSLGIACAVSEGAIYTTAAVNPGSNGGPCLDAHGQLLGIVSTWEADPASPFHGLGRVVPVDRIRAAYRDDPACRKAFPDASSPDPGREASLLEQAFQSAARKAAPSVVSLAFDRAAGPERQESWKGADGKETSLPVYGGPSSGVLCSADGYVLTSLSNLWGADRIRGVRVTLPGGKEAAARILGRDLLHGLVLLKAEGSGLPCPERSDPDALQEGRFVFAAGSRVFTAGVVSRIERRGGKASLVETDAGLSEANDGGALVDLRGRLLGVLVLRQPLQYGRNSGIGFAVPLGRIEPLLPRLKEGKDALPGILGVQVEEKGAGRIAVSAVQSEQARKAGLLPGDEILRLDGEAVDGFPDLREALSERLAGSEVEVVVGRGGVERTLRVVLSERS